jgi:hypothetical protein
MKWTIISKNRPIQFVSLRVEMKTRKIVCYDGLRSRKNGLHTRKNFLHRMHTLTHKERKFCKKPGMREKYTTLCNHPSSQNVKGWLNWSGAVLQSPQSCRKGIEAAKREEEERVRIARMPNSNEHKQVLDSFAKFRKFFPTDPIPSHFKKYLTKNELALHT